MAHKHYHELVECNCLFASLLCNFCNFAHYNIHFIKFFVHASLLIFTFHKVRINQIFDATLRICSLFYPLLFLLISSYKFRKIILQFCHDKIGPPRPELLLIISFDVPGFLVHIPECWAGTLVLWYFFDPLWQLGWIESPLVKKFERLGSHRTRLGRWLRRPCGLTLLSGAKCKLLLLYQCISTFSRRISHQILPIWVKCLGSIHPAAPPLICGINLIHIQLEFLHWNSFFN